MGTNVTEAPLGLPKWTAEAMLLLVTVVWGMSYGLAKTAVLFYPVLGFLAVRFCLTSVLLLPSFAGIGRRQSTKILATGLWLGLILLTIFVFETYGLSLTQASNSAFLISLCVVFTPFVEWAILKVRPSTAAFVATAISLAGAWLLTSRTSIILSTGDYLILMAALLRAVMVTFTNKLTVGKDIPALPLTAVQTGTVGLGSLVLAVVISPSELYPLPSHLLFWGPTAFLVVFCTLYAFFAQNYALRRISPTRVGLLMGAEPVFGALFAIYWFDETLGISGWIGGLMIVGASTWAVLRRR